MLRKRDLMMFGGILILLGVYFFPAGQDIVIITLTNALGSQMAAWNALWFITGGMIIVGLALGGHRWLGGNRLPGMLKMLMSNPLLLIGILVILFILFNVVGGAMT